MTRAIKRRANGRHFQMQFGQGNIRFDRRTLGDQRIDAADGTGG